MALQGDEIVAELQAFNRRLGLYKRLGGVQYGRVIEYARAYRLLQLPSRGQLLDLGTGKHSIFPLFCAWREPSVRCRITDVGDYVQVQRKVASRVGSLREALDKGRIQIEIQDATALAYEDESFDAVSAISTIEHIPGDGDSRAVAEAYRVLRPGGRLVMTVPLAEGGPFCDGYRRRSSYLRRYCGEPTFFQHTYDEQMLKMRLLEAAPFSLATYELWDDDGFYSEQWRRHVPLRNTAKHLVGWWLTEVSLARFHRVERYEDSRASVAIVCCVK